MIERIALNYLWYARHVRAVVRHDVLALHLTPNVKGRVYRITHIPSGKRICEGFCSLIAARRAYREICAMPEWKAYRNQDRQPDKAADRAFKLAVSAILERHIQSDVEVKAYQKWLREIGVAE